MSVTISQTPATASLAQSPIVFSVYSTGSVITNSGFQYMADLYYWTGSVSDSGSTPDYTLAKYPNTSLYGIFDLNRIINSTLTDLAIQNTSNVMYFACDFYYQYLSGSTNTYVTGSHTKSNVYKALDGYQIFQEAIGDPIYDLTQHWPLLTDGPATQSVFTTDTGNAGVYVGDVGTDIPTRIRYTSNLGTADYILSGSASSSQQIQQYPIGPAQSGFPLSGSFDYFYVQARTSEFAIGTPIKYEVECIQKYPNVRIKWKNRFGQFDYFDFYMVNRQSFSTEKRTYQPQLGTFQSTALSYNDYDSGVLNYIADSKQAISVNSFFISEDYNDIIKQLLVSDEIYWMYDEANNRVRPLTITSQNIVFKTGVVDKLIQYQFDFNFGQAYKLIL
jgi:hypothetical protein